MRGKCGVLGDLRLVMFLMIRDLEREKMVGVLFEKQNHGL